MSALLLGLLGCSDPHDGTWLATFTYGGDSCREEEDDQPRQDLLLDFFHTSADHLVVDGIGYLLYGEDDGGEFSVAYASGVQFEAEDCDLYVQLESASLVGEFTADLGLVGTLEVGNSSTKDDCWGSTSESTCTTTWEMEGVFLDARQEDRPLGHATWGYF